MAREAHQRRVAVLEPSPVLMVAVEAVEAERGGAAPEVYVHAGGQGFWVARMAAELGGRPRLCAPFGGRAGAVLPVVMGLDGVEVDAVPCHRSNAVWVSTGRDGEPATIAETAPPPLDRHEVDRLYGAALTGGLDAGVAVLTGLADPRTMPVEVYRRLAGDLDANGVIVIADVCSGALEAVLAGGGALVKVSDEDLVASGAAPDRSRAAVLGALHRLREAGARAVVASREAEPVLADTGDRIVELTPPRLRALNRRGAGDAMTGALAAGLARGLALEDALRLAVAAGALNVTRRGLGSGDRRAVERLAATIAVSEVS